MSKILKVLAAAAALLALARPGVFAQKEISVEDYQKMMQQAMKSGGSGQGQGESWDARVKVASGSVMVKASDSDEWSAVTGEVPLDPDDAIKTASDGVAELYLDDKGAIAIGRNTQLEMTSLDQGDAVFTLNAGSIVAKIKHFLNEKCKLQVRTPSAVCAVRGTEFAVEYGQMNKQTAVGVFDEGRVAVTQQAGDSGAASQEYVLEKNTELSFGPDQKRIHAVPLSNMLRYRGTISNMRARVTALRGWKPRSPERRAALRDRALKRKIIRRQIGGNDGEGAEAAEPRPRAAQGPKARAAAAKRAKARAAARRAKARRKAPPADDDGSEDTSGQ
jgi:hypothetical protein